MTEDPELFPMRVLLDAIGRALNQALRLAVERGLAVNVEVRPGTVPSVRITLRRRADVVIKSPVNVSETTHSPENGLLLKPAGRRGRPASP